MANNFSFSVMPSVNISRSRFARKSQHKTSLRHGYITPIYCDEVLPGDTRSIDMATLVRLQTPIAPIMDNIFIDYFAFFVPMRIVWDHAKEFFGENRESAGIPSTEYTIPCIDLGASGSLSGSQLLADHFGLPLEWNVGVGNKLEINALPFRAYYLIYNEWFRNQNITAPIAISTDDTDPVLVGDVDDSHTISDYGLLKACKVADYFTKALPYAQKSSPVAVSLGTTAPVSVSSSDRDALELKVHYGSYDFTPMFKLGSYTTEGDNRVYPVNGYNPAGDGSLTGGDLWIKDKRTFTADLSSATAVTINQLRYAFQLQKLLEKDALYGSRYWEILASHFGVRSPDASLQRPEYLGGYRQHINIDQVVSTAGYAASTSTTVGAPGANSVTGSKGSLFTKSFTEHGYIMIVAVPRAEHTYSQGVNRMWLRQGRYDFYWPVFANLGAQEVKKVELFAGNTLSALTGSDELFGYQEAWAEYRYKPSICSGILRPQASSSLDFWTLTDDFGSKPTLGSTFIEEATHNLDRALVTAGSTDEYIADFYFEDIAVRPMPVYSIPGLIDHH